MNHNVNTENSPPPQCSPATAPSAVRSSRPAVVGQFITVILIWSLTPLAAVWTVHEIHWVWGLFFRFSLALLFALPLLLYFRQTLPIHRQALLCYASGAIGLVGSMAFCYMGAQYVSSGLISIIYGLAPLLTGLIGFWFMKQSRLSSLQWIGLILGFMGLYFSLGLQQSNGQLHVVGVLLEIVAMLLYIVSALAVKATGDGIHPVSQMMGTTLTSWLVFLLILPFFADTFPSALPSMKALIALFYSALFSSVLAFICYYQLLKNIQTSTLMLTTILTPVIATLWGAVLNAEPFGLHSVLGLALLCMGLTFYAKKSFRTSLA